MYTYKFMKLVRVIPESAVLSRVPYGYVFLHVRRIPRLHTDVRLVAPPRYSAQWLDPARAEFLPTLA